eukprot:TRINITY_DN6527_c0_g1_i1.p1 TRINITY_DN6527_c0_g1~~TRINITY_DN6527_c0_g1_i1.p1  ORF type:complete len:153 (+),score=19.33 TRINITY_DN6527_c0_g1_i1:203-661(+)
MKTVKADPTFHNMMKRVAEEVHLEKHWIGSQRKAELYTAGDVEGHNGKDGKFYLLDTARFFPPEAPGYRQDLALRGNVPLYRMLRPELLQNVKQKNSQKYPPLNADVWTGWSDGGQKHQKDNQRVTRYLISEKVIPDFAELLRKEKTLFQNQ